VSNNIKYGLMDINDIINIDLRSDFENDNIGEDYTFAPRGFMHDWGKVYNESEGAYLLPIDEYLDRWVIEGKNSDGVIRSIYDYTSKSEYDADVRLLENYIK
jgi:hypothetical protein